MSLKLLIDEDSQALALVKTLRKANHDVVTANEANLTGQPDNIVLEYATQRSRDLKSRAALSNAQHNRIVLTRNCRDFEGEGCAVRRRIPNHLVEALHEANPNHPGIFAVYQEANPLKKMSRQDIVKAIVNLEAAKIPLQNQFISLNHWNY